MSAFVYFATLGLVFGTVLLVFGMRYASAVMQARTRAAGQTETADALAAIQASIADVSTRLAVVEKILKDVE